MYIYMYIYIYVCVCVCVCKIKAKTIKILNCIKTLLKVYIYKEPTSALTIWEARPAT